MVCDKCAGLMGFKSFLFKLVDKSTQNLNSRVMLSADKNHLENKLFIRSWTMNTETTSPGIKEQVKENRLTLRRRNYFFLNFSTFCI